MQSSHPSIPLTLQGHLPLQLRYLSGQCGVLSLLLPVLFLRTRVCGASPKTLNAIGGFVSHHNSRAQEAPVTSSADSSLRSLERRGRLPAFLPEELLCNPPGGASAFRSPCSPAGLCRRASSACQTKPGCRRASPACQTQPTGILKGVDLCRAMNTSEKSMIADLRRVAPPLADRQGGN